MSRSGAKPTAVADAYSAVDNWCEFPRAKVGLVAQLVRARH